MQLRKCARHFLYDKMILGRPQRPLTRILAGNPIYGCTTTLGVGSRGLLVASPQACGPVNKGAKTVKAHGDRFDARGEECEGTPQLGCTLAKRDINIV